MTYECHHVYVSELRCGPNPRYDPETDDVGPFEEAPWDFVWDESLAALHFSDCHEYKQHDEWDREAKSARKADAPSSATPENATNAAHASDDWLTVTEAATRLCKEMDGTVLPKAAKPRISKACTSGKIKSTGSGTKRRIDPDSLNTFILDERNKDRKGDEAP